MNFLDLFAGIGGFSLGARRAGFPIDVHFFSEIDEYAQQVYRKHNPGAIALGDIRKINVGELKEVAGDWIVAGGFP